MASIQKWRDHQVANMSPGDLLGPTDALTLQTRGSLPHLSRTSAEGNMNRAHKLHILSVSQTLLLKLSHLLLKVP